MSLTPLGKAPPALSPRDCEALRRWLTARLSYAEVMRIERVGFVGNERFSERARDVWLLLWGWSAPRFTGAYGVKQQRFYNRLGKDALYRRYERINAIIRRLTGE